MASLGCIEMNPWSSTIKNPDYPDWCIIDLDPDKNPFNQVIETARVIYQVLESMGIDSYCKTSGSTGIHIYIPLGAKYTYEESKEFARAIVTMVQKRFRDIRVLKGRPQNEKGKFILTSCRTGHRPPLQLLIHSGQNPAQRFPCRSTGMN